MRQYKMKSAVSFLMILLLLLGLLPMTLNVNAATVHTIPDASLSTIVNAVNINMGNDNLTSYQWKNVQGKVTRDDYGNHIFSVPIKSTTSEFSYSNVMELKFSDVMSIGGRKVNATVSIDSISVSKPYWVSGEEEGYLSFMMIYSNSIWFGTDSVINLYRAEKTTKVTTTFTYADTGEQIDVPLYQILNDIDICDRAGYEEIWQGNSGYAGDIYTFESCKLKIDQDNMKLEATAPTSGDASYLDAGAIVSINSSVVTQTYSAANASTGMILYSPYDDRNMTKPSKDVEEKMYQNGENVTWNINQKVHTWQADIFSYYTNFTIEDVLPEEVEYVNSKVLHNGVDVTDKGTLSYDSVMRKLKFEFKAEALNDTSLYDGGVYTLEINTKVVNKTDKVLTATNTATTNINEVKQNTSSVAIQIDYQVYMIETEIDHGVITENQTNVPYGSSRTISWTPDAGYYVSAVKIDGKNVYEGKTLDYPTSHEFSDINTDYDIQVETKLIPNLVITKNADKNVYNVDDEITYTITAEQTIKGAVATNVIITDKDKTKGLEFDLDTVQCSDETATIKKDNGAFTVSLNELVYGKTVVITVKGKVTKAELESSDIKNIATIKSDQTEETSSDNNIKINYNIITAAENGTIDDSVFDLKNGDNKTINFKPKDGYYLDEVKVDGEVLEISEDMDSYTFEKIKDNHLIEVKYEPYYKVIGKIDYGTITEDKTDIKKGENRTVTWAPKDGRYVTKVTVNGVVFYEGNTTSGYPTEYAFTNIESECEVIVETAPIPEETTVVETTQPEETSTQQVVTDPEETTPKETTVEEETTTKQLADKTPDKAPTNYKAPQTGGKVVGIALIIIAVIIVIGIFLMMLGRKKLNKRNKN